MVDPRLRCIRDFGFHITVGVQHKIELLTGLDLAIGLATGVMIAIMAAGSGRSLLEHLDMAIQDGDIRIIRTPSILGCTTGAILVRRNLPLIPFHTPTIKATILLLRNPTTSNHPIPRG